MPSNGYTLPIQFLYTPQRHEEHEEKLILRVFMISKNRELWDVLLWKEP